MNISDILNLMLFPLALISGIATLRSKQVSKFEFACCWIALLLELL